MQASGRRASVLAAMAGTVLVLGAPAASAHTDLAGGTPGPGDAVDAAVGSLTLSFTTPLVAQGTEIVVRDPAGSDHATTASTFGPEARVALKPLTTSGTYVVQYRAVAGDGHPITGSYRFRVTDRGALAGQAEGASAVDSTDAPTTNEAGFVTATTTQHSAGPSRVVGVLGAGTLVALLIAGARRRPEQMRLPAHDDRA